MATYNQWMNRKVYDAAARLSDAQLRTDRHAFFGSILGTLNHLAQGDTVWLKRFAQHPAGFTALAPLEAIAMPVDLKHLAFADLSALAARRTWLDQLIIDWTKTLREPDLDLRLALPQACAAPPPTSPFPACYCTFSIIRPTTGARPPPLLLTQAGVDVGDTDLLALID